MMKSSHECWILYAATLFLSLIFLIPAPSHAFYQIESASGSRTLEAVGYARLTGAYLRYPDLPVLFPEQNEWLAAGVGRLILDGILGPHVDYEFNGFIELSRGPALLLGGTFETPGTLISPYRTPRLTWDFWEDNETKGQLGIDRCSFSFHAQPIDASVGRMPINFSVTNVFTPNDFFAPFSPTAINKIYKPGVDALRVTVATGSMGAVEAVAVLGSNPKGNPDWDYSAVMGRASMVFKNFQWAVLGGKLARRSVVGASLQGAVGRLEIRSEGHIGFPDLQGPARREDDPYFRMAVSLDVPFTWRNASVGVDYQFLSDGASSPAGYTPRARAFFPDDFLYLGKHYVGLTAGVDILPIVRLNTLTLINAGDGSGLVSLMGIWNMWDEADLVAGFIAPWGASPSLGPDPLLNPVVLNSEFGASPFTAFLEVRLYF